MGTKFKFSLMLPEATASDTAKRELAVKIGEDEVKVLDLSASAKEVSGLVGADGDAVHAELIDIDGRGNRSVPSVFDGTIVDVVAPPKPGEMSVLVTEQFDDVVAE